MWFVYLCDLKGVYCAFGGIVADFPLCGVVVMGLVLRVGVNCSWNLLLLTGITLDLCC